MGPEISAGHGGCAPSCTTHDGKCSRRCYHRDERHPQTSHSITGASTRTYPGIHGIGGHPTYTEHAHAHPEPQKAFESEIPRGKSCHATGRDITKTKRMAGDRHGERKLHSDCTQQPEAGADEGPQVVRANPRRQEDRALHGHTCHDPWARHNAAPQVGDRDCEFTDQARYGD